VLLLDEPFGALDAKVRAELRRWLRRLHDEIHVTSVFVTHDQEEALEVADRIVVMNKGRVEQDGTPEQVYDFFRNLRPLNGGQEIINWLHSNKIPFTVLSAPLRGPFADSSKQAKRDWLDEHNPGTSDSAIFTSKKHQYAVTDGVANVLVDDFGPYIQKWIDAGGIPVKHEDETEISSAVKDTIAHLEKIYAPYLN
jgi:ABC-type multidrug transport system ATPase subunit